MSERTLVDASDFGAPTKRIRLFVIGVDPDQMMVPDWKVVFAKSAKKTTVRDAIADLMTAGTAGEDEGGFDLWRYDGRRSVSGYAERMRNKSGIFTGHRKTEHTKETLKRFAKVEPGGRDEVGKYARLSWDGLCPTLRAGTGSDRGSYQAVRPIHPSEDRVITPREAARLQGFPDWFLFHPTVWHSCRMIGNSVSPILAQTLMSRLKPYVDGKVPVRLAADSMVDRLTPERRSALMSRVRSKDTSPELRVRKVAHALGYRFRLHRRDLPGCPDLTFVSLGKVIFVHGCFWHRHPRCRKATMPKSRVAFWKAKFDRNVERDQQVKRKLRRLGWRVFTIWECQTHDPERLRSESQRFFSS